MVRHVSKRRKLRKLRSRRRVKPWVLTPELKFLDANFASAVVPQTDDVAAITSLNLLVQGDTQSQRVGMRVNVTSVQVKLRVTLQQFIGVGNSSTIRMIIGVDKQCNGAHVVSSNLLSIAGDIDSLRKPENANRYRILCDKTYVLNAPGLAWNGSAEVSSQMVERLVFFKRLQLPIFYTGTTATIGVVSQNNLFLFLSASVTAPITNVSGNVRIRYVDL